MVVTLRRFRYQQTSIQIFSPAPLYFYYGLATSFGPCFVHLQATV